MDAVEKVFLTLSPDGSTRRGLMLRRDTDSIPQNAQARTAAKLLGCDEYQMQTVQIVSVARGSAHFATVYFDPCAQEKLLPENVRALMLLQECECTPAILPGHIYGPVILIPQPKVSH